MHDVAGAWTVLILLVLAVTGVYMVRDEWLQPALNLIPGDAPDNHAVSSDARACSGPIGFDEAVARARVLAPGGALKALHAEDRTLRSWEIVLGPSDSRSPFLTTHIAANLDCGTVEVAQTPETRAPRTSTELWLLTLHDGSAFGTAGRILVAILGFAPLVLLWSGVRMWMRRRAWLRSTAAKRVAQTASQ